MEVVLMKNVEDYMKQVEPLLLKKEACNNLTLGILEQLVTQDSISVEPLLGSVQQDGQTIFSFIQTPPHNIIFPDIDHVNASVTALIAEQIYKEGVRIPGVIGPERVVKPFINTWEKIANVSAHVHMRQSIYQLDQVNSIKLASGSLEPAGESDKGLLIDWLIKFGEEANEASIKKHAETMAESFLSNKSVYLWKVGNTPVSMVNQSRETKHGSTINAVYTPDHFKRNGYATAAVATLSKQLLEQGSYFCCLYTDLDNPTSNAIYKKIGYQPVGDSIVYSINLC